VGCDIELSLTDRCRADELDDPAGNNCRRRVDSEVHEAISQQDIDDEEMAEDDDERRASDEEMAENDDERSDGEGSVYQADDGRNGVQSNHRSMHDVQDGRRASYGHDDDDKNMPSAGPSGTNRFSESHGYLERSHRYRASSAHDDLSRPRRSMAELSIGRKSGRALKEVPSDAEEDEFGDEQEIHL
jgi:hypothetical protein